MKLGISPSNYRVLADVAPKPAVAGPAGRPPLEAEPDVGCTGVHQAPAASW
jgi:hypothetical protein